MDELTACGDNSFENDFMELWLNHTETKQAGVTEAAKNLLRVLIYYNQFDYPLTAAEIIDRSAVPTHTEVYRELGLLVAAGLIFRFGGFYTLQNNYRLVENRMKANDLALKYIDKAKRISAIICHFPFVRSVMLSGSISKMYMDEKSDIDYFVITAPGRLWVARAFFVLFQKLALLNSTKLFCYNYMLSADHPAIEKHNIYTATEMVTLMPTYGYPAYRQFMDSNLWVSEYYPNFSLPIPGQTKEGNSRIKRLLERIFGGSAGERLDIFLMNLTAWRWRKKQPAKMFTRPEAYMHLDRHTAKGHTQDHYPRILKGYEQGISHFENRFGISLAADEPNP